MLGVVDDSLAGTNQERDRLADHPQVLFAIDLHHLLQMKPPGLADERAHRRKAIRQHSQRGIIGCRHSATPGHPESGDLCVFERFPGEQLEELQLLRIGAREARLDQVDPELVQPVRHPHLLLRGQRHALPLHTIAEGRVVELDASHAALVGTATMSSHSA